MEQKDIQFLQELQANLIKADNDPEMNDYQANPRFWVVMQTEKVYSPNDGEPHIHDNHEARNYTVDDFAEIIDEEVYDADEESITAKWADVDKNDAEELSDFANTHLDKFTDVINLESREVIAENTLFITKEACQKHIDNNLHHYIKPHTYAMTAWRSPEFERFMELFKQLDLNQIKVSDN